MTKSRRRGVDPFEREIEIVLEPGGFIADRACFSFVSGLDEVAATIVNLISTEPARAVGLYETFLAGCYEMAEELDDSSGSFGRFDKQPLCVSAGGCDSGTSVARNPRPHRHRLVRVPIPREALGPSTRRWEWEPRLFKSKES